MATIGIDLSLRSTGIVAYNGGDGPFDCQFALLKTDVKKHNDEVLLRYNTAQILEWLHGQCINQIAIEGLSYNGKSASKDLIAANYWYLRMELKRVYPDAPLHILPVTLWRSPLFSKAENKELTANKKLLKQYKADLKKIKDKGQKKEFVAAHVDLVLNSNIKYLTFNKLPEGLQKHFGTYGFANGTFDLSDAWHIAKYTHETFK